MAAAMTAMEEKWEQREAKIGQFEESLKVAFW
jgi:hypothetical protein